MTRKKPIIYESTLRESTQMPGVNLSPEDYITIGGALLGLGVDVLEVSCYDTYTAKICREMIRSYGEDKILLHDMSAKSSVDRFKAVGGELFGMYVGMSNSHLKSLGLDKRSVLRKIEEDISYAVQENLRGKFVFEDATRQKDFEFLVEAVEVAMDAGIESICPADTVGKMPPWEYAKFTKKLKVESGARIITHNHDDFGWALAATLNAYEMGAADILTCSIMGMGERAGITPTEQLLIYLRLLYRFQYKTENLSKVIEHVSRCTGIKLKPNDPQGPNSFTHKSGIHLRKVYKDPKTYEAFPPEMVGRTRKIAVSSLIGKRGIELKLRNEYNLPRHLLSEEKTILIRDDVRKQQGNFIDQGNYPQL